MTTDGEALAPDFAVRERSPGEGESAYGSSSFMY